ncbi:hypothetical protein F5Y18DRAFT_435235 [Xylariaceae sp. FL1019]|nr:hypothetical protein F5Y18DRAFT_435235 [Xylariaceae sp. FL1019]
MMAPTKESQKYMYNHVFFPSKLPQESDYDSGLEHQLLWAAIQGLVAWKVRAKPEHQEHADGAILSLRNLQRTYSAEDGSLHEASVLHLLGRLPTKATVPLLIREQNAAVLITKSKDGKGVVFEIFEISPEDHATMSAKGRLRRSFPGAAVVLADSVYEQTDFQTAIAHTLTDMSQHAVAAVQPKVKKAGNNLHEDRDTNHPGMVSEVLLGFLKSIGHSLQCPAVAKNMRDEVLWQEARSPWRRSPMWLLIRVTLRLGFQRNAEPSDADNIYKQAILCILCNMAKVSIQMPLSNDIIFSMKAKISRRCLKLKAELDESLTPFVKECMEAMALKLSTQWSRVQQETHRQTDHSSLSKQDFTADSYVSVPTLDRYILEMRNRQHKKVSGLFTPSSTLLVFSPQDLPQLPQSFRSEDKSSVVGNLEAFETWVAFHCRHWSQNNRNDACTKLGELIVTYHNLAKPFYSTNPEAISTMLLTIYELWIACDQAAVGLNTSLSEYDPGVPSSVLQNLLLPLAAQMRTLRHVESYLNDRSKSSRFSSMALYCQLETPECFPVRYFDGSNDMKNRYKDITQKAKSQKRAKLEEFKKLKTRYHNLIESSNGMNCEYENVLVDRTNGFYERRHKSSCVRCRTEKEAKELEIYFHEWPLPENSLKAKSIIFELYMPLHFQKWREATFYLLRNVLEMEYHTSGCSSLQYTLWTDPHLPVGPPRSSIGLLSTSKPHTGTHRRKQRISTATEEDVCVNNGLNYQYFDFESGSFMGSLNLTESIPKSCTYSLPSQSAKLQEYLFRLSKAPDGPGPNVAIAHQANIPAHMTEKEGRDLATLPLGHRIQWHNILVQLAAPSIDFNNEETAAFIFQCIYQSGPPHDSWIRASHAIAGDERFSRHVLSHVNLAWERISKNWDSARTLSVLVAITTRLLSLASSDIVRQNCFDLLKTLRAGAFAWVELLRNKSHDAIDQDVRMSLKSKSVELALICAISFDVERELLPSVLESDSDASLFVQCSILIQEGKPSFKPSGPSSQLMFACLNYRFQRLLYNSTQSLIGTHSGISDAVSRSWPGFNAECEWRAVENSTQWLVTETEGGTSLQVHYDLLTGELLVNGVPLCRPPKDYELHSLWSTLFGHVAVEVMPTAIAGMQFSAKRKHQGYNLVIGLNTASGNTDLLVQASTQTTMYETVPARLLEGLFPDHFVQNFVHWYDYSNDSLEFRPLSAPWRLESDGWTLVRSWKGWALSRGDTTLLNVCSETSKAVAKILDPLTDQFQTHMFLRHLGDPVLEIEIPLLQLGFLLRQGELDLRSREFRGMWIDHDQSLGTLIGFTNKMILKDHNRRLVLVPEGEISWASKDDHTCVYVSKTTITDVHALRVDDVLGRLIDNGTLQDKLFLSYLHVLTSYSLPDPLTGKTGVEQALWILNSAAVRSFDQLSDKNIATLRQIARLTPKREYYPLDKCVMATVSWIPGLSSLSQHDGLYTAVSEIFGQAKQMCLFYPGTDSKQLDVDNHFQTNVFLMERDQIRSSTFRVSGVGAECHTTQHDQVYRGRDRNCTSIRGTKAYVLSSMLYSGQQNLQVPALSVDELWKNMPSKKTVVGPIRILQLEQLRYSAEAANSGLDVSIWLELHRVLATGSNDTNKFNLMMWLSALDVNGREDMSMLQLLARFFTSPALGAIDLPNFRSCQPSKGYKASRPWLQGTIEACAVKLDNSPEARLAALTGESWPTFSNRRAALYARKKDKAVSTVVSQLMDQWPRRTLTSLNPVAKDISDYVIISDAENLVGMQFEAWYANLQLLEYLQAIQKVISGFPMVPVINPKPTPVMVVVPSRKRGFVSVSDFFAGQPPKLEMLPTSPDVDVFLDEKPQKSPRLVSLIESLEKTAPQVRYEQSYIENLKSSMHYLQEQDSARTAYVCDADQSVSRLNSYLSTCREQVDTLYQILCSTMKADQSFPVYHGPEVSRILLLQHLSSGFWKFISQDWKQCIVQYGLAVSALQKAERLVQISSSRTKDDLIKELANVGHSTWAPLQHPEWLLLEVESNITIRDVQEWIACEMIAPRSCTNAVMQLNMGEGKSSVIVPMVAAEMANGTQIARVIVAKPQSKQMEQMLISKLGGLINRRVYRMPFSRALNANAESIAALVSEIAQRCKEDGGVFLVQPEHLLSFQVMGVEYCCGKGTRDHGIGQSLVRIQNFFDHNARDIIDESDENFSPKFELVYTMGTQRSLELSPARWICIQQILDHVRFLAVGIAAVLPESIEVKHRSNGSFPRLRLLKCDAGKLLTAQVAIKVCEQGLPGFPIAVQQKSVRESVHQYITQYDLSEEEIRAVENPDHGSFLTDSTRPILLLLRGILAGGVLSYAFSQKRWRVNYGLAWDRTPPTKLAVPYRAKDNPTARSEFSHPDVTILLTTLTYYYGGLENADLFITLSHLMNSDQAGSEYACWIADAPDMPSSFQQLEGVNIEDRFQCEDDIFPHLRYNKAVVDYFLQHIVFPKEAKEFPYKLSASGWDIGKTKAHYTTGFSGTNDARDVLPLDVKHLDLPSQSHTNALVLEYLLQPENSVLLLPVDARPSTNARNFLTIVTKLEKPTRVILDVGAQILEMTNRQVAESLLQLEPTEATKAVVFINDDDETCVIDRQGRVELLQTSPHATQLESCFIFLDEAHTRGIDLKLPTNYRAAVTLGPSLSKDRLVQACMRLRKLGKGQSVVFCVDDEIKMKISACTQKSAGSTIEVQDVLHWAISETFAETRRHVPLWAMQGKRFLRQEQLWKSAETNGHTIMSAKHARLFLEDEAQSLEMRYGPRESSKQINFKDASLDDNPKLDVMEQRCKDFGALNFASSTLEEEQERELSPEIEQERQLERPPMAKPLGHRLHPDVQKFVNSGVLSPKSAAYMGAFAALRSTSAASGFDPAQLHDGQLLVTVDFANTVEESGKGHLSDSFQRPVQWILSRHPRGGDEIDTLMIISPFEAEKLITKMQTMRVADTCVTLHLYKARAQAAHSSLDRLNFFNTPASETPYKIPDSLVAQLNLFAGQLYFSNYQDYVVTGKFLGLATEMPKEGEVVAMDGYVICDSNGRSRFDKSPVQFMQILTSKIRQNGESITKTHVGGMLEGNLLQRSDIEGSED